VPTGGTGGGFFSRALNSLVLFGAANAFYEATEGKIKREMDEFLKEHEGMTGEELGEAIMQHDLGLTDGQFKNWNEATNVPEGTGHGRFFGEIPEEYNDSFERMNEVAAEMTGEVGETRQVNADMAAAVTELSGLPAEMRASVEAAVISGMGQVTIVVDDRGMNAISDRVRGGWGNQIMQMVR
jgi:hypothetical protein